MMESYDSETFRKQFRSRGVSHVADVTVNGVDRIGISAGAGVRGHPYGGIDNGPHCVPRHHISARNICETVLRSRLDIDEPSRCLHPSCASTSQLERRVHLKPKGGRVNSGSKRMTLQQLAEEAGVSTPTISKVLNGRPDVAAATRERILRVLREHEYVPRGASALPM